MGKGGRKYGRRVEDRGKEGESLSRRRLINRSGIASASLRREGSSRGAVFDGFYLFPRRKRRPARYPQPRTTRFLSREIMRPLVDRFYDHSV